MTRVVVLGTGLHTRLIIQALINADIEAVLAAPNQQEITISPTDVYPRAMQGETGKRKAQWKQETRGRKQP